ncbi:hypothetical protein D3C72_1993700 [compost metagenome]
MMVTVLFPRTLSAAILGWTAHPERMNIASRKHRATRNELKLAMALEVGNGVMGMRMGFSVSVAWARPATQDRCSIDTVLSGFLPRAVFCATGSTGIRNTVIFMSGALPSRAATVSQKQTYEEAGWFR